MIKLISRLFFILILFTAFSLFFLSFYELETKYFNTIIQQKVKEFNPSIDLKFQDTKILLDLKKIELKIKIQDPIIYFNKRKIELNKLNLNISIRALLKKEFALQHSEIGLIKIDIKKLIEFANQIKPSAFLFITKETINEGQIEGEASINFDNNGKIQDDYKIIGNLVNFDVKLLKQLHISNTSAKFELIKNEYQIYLIKGRVNGIHLTNSEFKINKENKNLNIKGNLVSKANIKDIQNTFYLLNFKPKKDLIEESEISFDIKTSFSFQLQKYVKIKNLLINGSGKIHSLNLKHKINTNELKKIFVNYNNVLQFKDINIKFSSEKKKDIVELEGLINLTNEYEKFKSKIIFDKEKNNESFYTELDIKSTNVKLSSLNYEKEINHLASLKFKGSHKKNKGFDFDFIEFKESDNLILINNVQFNEKIQINNVEELVVQTTHDNFINNKFKLNKDGNIKIQGKIFDVRPLLNTLYKSNKRKLFSKKFNEKILINIEEIIADNRNNLSEFSMISEIKNGEYTKLSAKGNFSDDEIIEASIYKRDDNKKVIYVISDRVEPFIIGLDFIKGFRGGKLEYESVYSKGISNSKIKILDFKVSKVPALTQLLTLASLQGIADTLTGEGIRFDELEMNLNSEKNVINIEELYAIGPAISLLMNGYVDKGNIVSFKGTLVPARTINKIVGTIPVIGDILVGKKVGEGVFGVSFKMKGPPNDIKTVVNPIKTLTPRFLTRALEKIKKRNIKNTN